MRNSDMFVWLRDHTITDFKSLICRIAGLLFAFNKGMRRLSSFVMVATGWSELKSITNPNLEEFLSALIKIDEKNEHSLPWQIDTCQLSRCPHCLFPNPKHSPDECSKKDGSQRSEERKNVTWQKKSAIKQTFHIGTEENPDESVNSVSFSMVHKEGLFTAIMKTETGENVDVGFDTCSTISLISPNARMVSVPPTNPVEASWEASRVDCVVDRGKHQVSIFDYARGHQSPLRVCYTRASPHVFGKSPGGKRVYAYHYRCKPSLLGLDYFEFGSFHDARRCERVSAREGVLLLCRIYGPNTTQLDYYRYCWPLCHLGNHERWATNGTTRFGWVPLVDHPRCVRSRPSTRIDFRGVEDGLAHRAPVSAFGDGVPLSGGGVSMPLRVHWDWSGIPRLSLKIISPFFGSKIVDYDKDRGYLCHWKGYSDKERNWKRSKTPNSSNDLRKMMREAREKATQ